ncbi:hypothetical protein ABWH98_16095 [Labrenzia sp. ac12]|uniref:hypothetical protein n=1 Tax=uncultured Roseibium sp. TaxID=1936171 RepID=UPI0026050688|nr:hypothetical protein [uncultured Roseibium sp.]
MTTRIPTLAAWLFRLAALWMLIGLVLGIVMAASHDHALSPVHVHTNLLGWATLALTGLLYTVIPAMADNRFARLHFWLHALGLPVMMAALAAYALGHAAMEPVIAVGAIAVTAGLAFFTVNLFRTL